MYLYCIQSGFFFFFVHFSVPFCFDNYLFFFTYLFNAVQNVGVGITRIRIDYRASRARRGQFSFQISKSRRWQTDGRTCDRRSYIHAMTAHTFRSETRLVARVCVCSLSCMYMYIICDRLYCSVCRGMTRCLISRGFLERKKVPKHTDHDFPCVDLGVRVVL